VPYGTDKKLVLDKKTGFYYLSGRTNHCMCWSGFGNGFTYNKNSWCDGRGKQRLEDVKAQINSSAFDCFVVLDIERTRKGVLDKKTGFYYLSGRTNHCMCWSGFGNGFTYNKLYRKDPEWQILLFGMTVDHRGRVHITDVQTSGGDPQANAQAERVMNSWFSGIVRATGNEKADERVDELKEIKEAAEALGLAILEAHDDEYGDVKEFKHEVVFGVGFGGSYQVLSPDADRAALMEMEGLTQEIGTALGNFFGETMGIENPFAVLFGSDGLLSLGENSLSSVNLQATKQVLEDINGYLVADEAGEDTEGMLPDELLGIGKKFLALKDVRDKIHDRSLVPKEGVRFTLLNVLTMDSPS